MQIFNQTAVCSPDININFKTQPCSAEEEAHMTGYWTKRDQSLTSQLSDFTESLLLHRDEM